MTRYQTAVATLSVWLTKARTPSDEVQEARTDSLPRDWHRPELPWDRPSFPVRLWRTIASWMRGEKKGDR
jgi:hypothetical protein